MAMGFACFKPSCTGKVLAFSVWEICCSCPDWLALRCHETCLAGVEQHYPETAASSSVNLHQVLFAK